MKSKRIIKKHVLADKIPLLIAALLMIIGQYLPNFAVATVMEPFYEKLDNTDHVLIWYFLCAILLSLLFVILFER